MSAEVKILDGNTFVVSDDARRHRGLDDRPDRPLLVRHALPLAVGAHGRRPAAQPAVGRRPAVLRDALLPGAGHRHRLRRRQALGHPPARRRRRLPRGAHDPQPRRRSRSTSRCASRPTATSPTSSRSRTPSQKKGEYYSRVDDGRLVLGYRRETLRARDLDLGDRAPAPRRARPDASPCTSSPTASGRPTCTSSPRRRRRRLSMDAPKYERHAKRAAAEHGAQPRQVARRRARAWSATGTPLKTHVPPQPRRPGRAALLAADRCPATACRPPGCPGS